jgi:tripartite-type tricarboxylate transporter receptor subunit TctC
MSAGAVRVLGLVLLACAAPSTQAQSAYPMKPIRLVVPYTPGASNDTLSRASAESMSPLLGQPIVIDNRPGAGGMIGAEHVARSAPDGYTILNVQASFATNAAIRKKMPYDVARDFSYIGMMAKSPMIVVVHPSMPVRSLKELIAIARKRPGDLNYGSSGTGGSNHLATELFAKTANVRITHVPYKSIGPALTDLVGGHVQMVITSLPSALVQVKAGRLKALAVAGEQRSAFAPDIPTCNEQGMPYVSELWWGLAAPARTPPDVVDRLSDALRKAMQTPQLTQRYATEGAEPVPMSPPEFTRYVQEEVTRWRKVVSDAGLTLE